MPVSAEVIGGRRTRFRVWAPARERVEVVLDRGARAVALEREAGGFFARELDGVGAGTRYRLRLDGGARLFPDPFSRRQPDGPEGDSEVVDPGQLAWSDAGWRGVPLERAVFYELHVGTFTREGTWAAAARELPELARFGVTVVEMMPVAEFPGRFGWGYDGVGMFAPYHGYGAPDDLRRFVDRAHALGVAVILDVVYNHLGPSGNFMREYAPQFFSKKHTTEWGEAFNFDEEGSGPVRDIVTSNAAYWIREFHFDGLRLDATQCIFDDGEPHVIADIARAARAAAPGRTLLLIAENESQEARLLRPPERGGFGLDAAWNDDFHHAATVALTGRREAYYTDYAGSPGELLAAAKWGYLYQGQRYAWQKKRRGRPALDVHPARFVAYLENHDQVANSLRGARGVATTSASRWRAMTGAWLLAPSAPLFFQGQELGSSKPFLYFADHEPGLAKLVRKGRAEFLTQFPSIAPAASQGELDDPGALETFRACVLDLEERVRHAKTYAMHEELLRLRREDEVLAAARAVRDAEDPRLPSTVSFDGAVIGEAAYVLRYFGGARGDRLLVVNLGKGARVDPAWSPLLAPPEGARWASLWASEEPRWDGRGVPDAIEDEGAWSIPGECTVLFTSEASS